MNTVARMESNSEAMRIHISTDTFQLLQVRLVEGGLAVRLGTDDYGVNRTSRDSGAR